MRRRIALLLALCLLLTAGGCAARAAAPAETGPAESAPTPTPEPTSCPHLHWTDGVCDDCGLICLHEHWTDGVCDLCGMVCPHAEHDPVTRRCLQCGMTVRHCFVDGVCACGAVPVYETEELPEALCAPCPEQGELRTLTYTYTDAWGSVDKNITVYLPYGYDPTERYDVLILMHGLDGTEDYWLGEPQEYRQWSGVYVSTVNVLDNLIYLGYCEKLIVAAPTFYRDDNNRLTYDPQWDGRLFGAELRKFVLPCLADSCSTWAASGREADLIAARDHFGYIGLSMGSIIAFQSVMPECLDMVSWYGCLSGFGYDAPAFNALIGAEKYRDYDIHYFYNSVGVWDAAHDEHLAGYTAVTQLCDKLTDGKNAAFVEISQAKHEFKVWILGLVNCLEVFFNFPAETAGNGGGNAP